MSMNTYPLNDVGLVIDDEAAAYINLSNSRNLKQKLPEEIQKIIDNGEFEKLARTGQLPCDYHNLSDVHDIIESFSCYCSEFNGSVSSFLPDKTNEPMDQSYDDDMLLYVPLSKAPDYFKATYASHEEMLQEIQNCFAEHSIEFPDDFDWWRRIVEINGTYFC